MTGPAITAPAPTREAIEASYQRIRPVLETACSAAAVLGAILPPIPTGEGSPDPLTRTRAAWAQLVAAIEATGALPPPGSLGLDWTGPGPVPSPDQVAGPADAGALAALLSAARVYGEGAADAALTYARARPSAGVITRIAEALRALAAAVRADVQAHVASGLALAMLPVRLSQALLVWSARAEAIAGDLFRAIGGGVAIGTGAVWLALALVLWFVFSRR